MYDRRGLSREELTDGLRRWATGSYRTEAAVHLLIEHERWLEREDFQRLAIWVDDGVGDAYNGRVVGIDWDVAASLLNDAPASSSERRVLALVIALVAGSDHPVDLGDALTSLDASNTSRVLEALGHAVGLHDRHTTIVIDGHVTK